MKRFVVPFCSNLMYEKEINQLSPNFFLRLICTAKDCGPLEIPKNGSLFGGKTTFPNVVTFSCAEGFVLKGSISRTCLSTGNWSGVKTFCKGMV